MPAHRLTTNDNATVAERVKIAAGVNRLVALDALPCALLDCIAGKFAENAETGELESLSGTLTILLARVDNELTKRPK